MASGPTARGSTSEERFSRSILRTGWCRHGSRYPGGPTTVSYLLEPIDGGTRVTVRHSGFTGRPESCDGHAEGWQRVLGWLAAHLSPAAAGRMFLCRLIPPRPTFMQDMTSDERAIMEAHGQYWHTKLAEGVAIAFGPVADPAGGWGLGIVEARDDAELKAFQSADPAIASGRGFRYESLPSVRLVR